jgi:hypothetical protein
VNTILEGTCENLGRRIARSMIRPHVTSVLGTQMQFCVDILKRSEHSANGRMKDSTAHGTLPRIEGLMGHMMFISRGDIQSRGLDFGILHLHRTPFSKANRRTSRTE